MVVQAEVNPYQSPVSEANKVAHATEDLRETRRIKLAWIGVFLLNLCVPVFFGWNLTSKGGRLGMFAATLVLFLAGYALCAAARRIAKAIIVGGVAVGLIQVFPVLHVIAGIAALFFTKLLAAQDARDETILDIFNDFEAFVATVMTGGLLMAAAFLAGLAIRGLFAATRHRA